MDDYTDADHELQRANRRVVSDLTGCDIAATGSTAAAHRCSPTGSSGWRVPSYGSCRRSRVLTSVVWPMRCGRILASSRVHMGRTRS